MPIDGEEFLFYKAFPIHVGIIRATTADADGNLTMEREALTLEALAIAMAAHNSGGIVIAQVERVAERGSLNPRQVKVPGVLVDCVVLAERPEHHQQTFVTALQPGLRRRDPRAGEPAGADAAERAQGHRAPRGAGADAATRWSTWASACPRVWPQVATEEQIIDLVTLTAEPGVIGGIPASGLNFGAAVNTQAIIDQPSQFDFYDGGGLDLAVLGLAQADAQGNLNVSKFGPRLAGAGGFINISQNGAGGGLRRHLHRRRPAGAHRRRAAAHRHEGTHASSCGEVEHRTFSGEVARQRGQRVLYVTERCGLPPGRQRAGTDRDRPGIDLQRDILAQMGLPPRHQPAPADDGRAACSPTRRWACASGCSTVPLAERLSYRARDRHAVHQLRRPACRHRATTSTRSNACVTAVRGAAGPCAWTWSSTTTTSASAPS
jgi:propionate CoA-transferase